MLDHPSRAVAVWTLQYLDLDEPILQTSTNRAPKHLGRLDDSADYPTCLAAWAIDRGEVAEASQIAGLVAHWRTALNLSNAERDALKAILTGVSILRGSWPSLPVSAQKLAATSPWFPQALRLIAGESSEVFVRIRHRVDQLSQTDSGLSPTPLLSGDDLITLGLCPGPIFQEILAGVYDAQLEDRVRTREEAEALARELGAQRGV